MEVQLLRSNNHVDKVNKWLSASDPSINLNEAIKKRQKGTGSWFLQSETFKDWKSGIRRHLWLCGIQGCGKTVLSATIIEHLNKRRDSSQVVLEFFFDFTDSDKQTLDELIRSLIAQLYSRCEASREELDNLFSSCEDGKRQPTSESLFTTLLQMANYVQKVLVVIDALDECKTRRCTLLWMKKLASSGHEGIQLLVTSRKEEDIEFELKGWLHHENVVSIQKDVVDRDIRVYVHDRVRNGLEFERWYSNPSVQDEIEAGLMTKSGGM